MAAQVIELEVDCEADDFQEGTFGHRHHSQDHGHGHRDGGHSSLVNSDQRTGSSERSDGGHQYDDEPGYLRQEIVGIGGVVKQKVKKRVTVGACVEEHEDERETGQYLEREVNGQDRSWCDWCWRVVPNCKDVEELEGRV